MKSQFCNHKKNLSDWEWYIDKPNTFTPDHTWKLNPFNYGIHPVYHEKVIITNIRNLSKLCGKVISTEFVLSNITQFKFKSKAHPQNHWSGINMRQTHSISWKQQGYVGNYYWATQINSCVFFFASLPSSYCFYFFKRNNHLIT